jgi:multidrug efflux pump subunit AcrA (membrane-fusion protein)
MNDSLERYPEGLPRLRGDVERFSWPAMGDVPAKHFVRDPKTLLVFECGETGAFLYEKLDGRTALEDIFSLYEEKFGATLSPDDFDLFVGQLAENGLLVDVSPQKRKRTFAEILDPEVFLPLARLRFMKGDRLMAVLARRLSWLFSRPAQWLGAAAIVAALAILVLRFGGYTHAVWLNWSPGFAALTMAVSCLLVQSPRALVHGMMCKRSGGQVSAIGLGLLYYVMPALYCDWGEIIWVAGKEKRRWAIFSGIYYQLLVFALGTIGWWLTTAGTLANAFWLSMSFASGMGLLLFGANPLVQMDGYLLLVSFIEVPRLRERSLAILGSWMTGRSLPEILTRREKRRFLLYGALTFIYAFLHLGVVLGMFWSQLTPAYEGSGAIATILVAVYFAQKPMVHLLMKLRLFRWLFAREGGLLRWSARLAVASGIAALGFIPVSYETGGPFRFLPSHRVDLRSEVEGVVEKVLVREGQWVEAGQPVAVLSGRAPSRNLEAAQGQVERIQAQVALLKRGSKPEQIDRARAGVRKAEAGVSWSKPRADRMAKLFEAGMISQKDYENALMQRDVDAARLQTALADLDVIKSGPHPEQVRALEADQQALQALADDYTADLERTTLTSPIAGRVVTPDVEGISGMYLKPGQRDQVMEIEDTRTVQAEVEVSEEEVADVRPGAPVRLVAWTWSDTPIEGRVVSIAPVAAATSRDSATATVFEESADVAALRIPGASGRIVRVITEVPNADGRLKSEMTGYAKIAAGNRPLWDVILRPIIRWVQVKAWSWIP